MKEENSILGISLIVCKNTKSNKYLAVNEKDGSWWVPGGRVDAPELFTLAAIRQCMEEAGVKIILKGILRIQQSLSLGFSRLKIVFYAEPADANQVPKQIADKQSLGAAYLTIQEIKGMKQKWRGPQIYDWPQYIQEGGQIYPLSILRERQIRP